MTVNPAAPKTSPRKQTGPFHFVTLYRATPLDRVDVIKAGVEARKAKRLSQWLNVDQSVIFKALNLKTATVNRKAARGEKLSMEDGERVVGLAKLVGQLEAMLEESGDAQDFDVRSWISQWLRDPLPMLGGNRPIDLLDTMEGQAVVARALAQMQSGAYA